MANLLRFLAPATVGLVLGACAVDSEPPESDRLPGESLSSAAPQTPAAYCAIASFDGPNFYVKNFSDYDSAKQWLSQFSNATGTEIDARACAAPIACPDYYDPLCGVVSGGENQTYGNGCELLAATRQAAGSSPPGEAKGATQYDGECVVKDQCAGQPCGVPCDGPFGSPLPTACDGFGSCVPEPTCVVKDQCAGQPCGVPCDGPFGSPLPTACDGFGSCVPQPTCKEAAYDCDLSKVLCDAPTPLCADGETPSVDGVCYGPCVPIDQCKCEPGVPTQCPDGWVCWASTNRCGPYVN